MAILSKPKAADSTPFSDFIRNASSARKKQVYERVLEKATERQNRLIPKAVDAKQIDATLSGSDSLIEIRF